MHRSALRPIVHALLLGWGSSMLIAPTLVSAQTLPSGMSVVQGQATVDTQGNRMTVTNSHNALLNWQAFSVGQGAAVRFDQPSTTSTVVNRVVGQDPSNILGTLSSNGRVWLLNPNGVLFGPQARVDVAGLVASTLNITDANWRAGKRLLEQEIETSTSATVVNQGTLRTTSGGSVLLVSGPGGVTNAGSIDAPGGQAALLSANAVELSDSTTPNIIVRIDTPNGSATNTGTLQAAGGRIDLAAAIVNQSGILNANALSGQGGEIHLSATSELTTSAASVTSANGDTGGQVVVEGSAGRDTHSGRVEVLGSNGTGGSITVSGNDINLLGSAVFDASGSAGGGSVTVGRGPESTSIAAPPASYAYVSGGATLRADATESGNGGHITLGSDRFTWVFGTLSATGGPQGGDGGLIDTYGVGLGLRPSSLQTQGFVGTPGTWRITSPGILIAEAFNESGYAENGVADRNTRVFENYFGVVSPEVIATALAQGNNVTVAARGGTGDLWLGDVDATTGASLTPARVAVGNDMQTPVTLTLQADRNITVTASTIETAYTPLSVHMEAAGGGKGTVRIIDSTISTGASYAGALARHGDIVLTGTPGGVSGPNLAVPGAQGAVGYDDHAGDSITSDYGGGPRGTAVQISGSALDAGTSSIVARGYSIAQSSTATGVWVDSQSSLIARDINLYGWVDSNADRSRTGVRVEGSLDATHSILLEGHANSGQFQVSTESDANVVGVRITGFVSLQPIEQDPSATLSIVGTTNDAAADADSLASAWTRAGVTLEGESYLGAGGGTVIDIQGVNQSPNPANSIYADPGTLLDFTGAGSARIVAAASSQTQVPTRIELQGTVQTPTGSFSIGADRLALAGSIGPAYDPGNQPLALQATSSASQTASATVSLSTSTSTLTLQAHDLTTSPDFTISTELPVAVFADNVQLAAGTSITSTATNDAVVFAGRDGTSNMTSFILSGCCSSLNVPNGRWLLYASDPTDADRFSADGLAHDFRQYAAVRGAMQPQGLGNGFLFSVSPDVAITNDGTINKVYDGTTAVPPGAQWRYDGLLRGDEALSLDLPLVYANKNAGTGKAVTFEGFNGQLAAVDAAGKPVYGYQAHTGLQGDIEPATLTYTADRSTRRAGDALQGLTGSVTGFIPGEDLPSATTGAAQFLAQVPPNPAPGQYPVLGTGLSAPNYRFVQADTNATALTLSALSFPNAPPETTARPTPAPAPLSGGTLDATGTVTVAADGRPSFNTLDVASLSESSLAAALAARQQYKAALLANAVLRLEDNPQLADAPACLTLEQAQTGTCLITEELKALAARATPAPSAGKTAAAFAQTAKPVDLATLGAPTTTVLRPQNDHVARRERRVAALPQIQRKVAVVIGIDHYRDQRIPSLDGAQNDAQAVADVLSNTLGYETALLLDGTKETILRRLNQLALQVGPADSVIIYYAGHGDLVEKTKLGYWIPANASADRPETWISNTDISKMLGRISASQVALISDSCFSGSLVATASVQSVGSTADADTLLKHRAAVVMSSGGNEPVADTGRNGHSVFAWNLMQSLRKVASWRPGANVFEQVRSAVAKELPQRPRYGPATQAGHEPGADYLFEQRHFELAGP